MPNPREAIFPPGTIVRIDSTRLKVLEWCEDGSLVGLEEDGETAFLPADHIRDVSIRTGGFIEMVYHLAVSAFEDTHEARVAAIRQAAERARDKFAAETNGAPALGPDEIEGFLERFAAEAR